MLSRGFIRIYRDLEGSLGVWVLYGFRVKVLGVYRGL